MTDKQVIAKLRELTIEKKKGFAERLFLVLRGQGDSTEKAASRAGETLKYLHYIDMTKLCETGT